MKLNERCGTTHLRHSRSPRLEPWGVVTMIPELLPGRPAPFPFGCRSYSAMPLSHTRTNGPHADSRPISRHDMHEHTFTWRGRPVRRSPAGAEPAASAIASSSCCDVAKSRVLGRGGGGGL